MTDRRYGLVRDSTTLIDRAVKKPPRKTSTAYQRHNFSKEELEEEEWKPIINYDGVYEVSSLGQIRSLTRQVVCGRYNGQRIAVGQLRIQQLTKEGYLVVSLRNAASNRKHVKRLVHRLVATAFIANPANKPEVNHEDGNTQNNRVSNLTWSTPQENADHAKANGLVRKSFVERRNLVKKLHLSGNYNARAIAAATGYSVDAVYRIIKATEIK